VKKSGLIFFFSVAFGCVMARADTVDIVFDHGSQTGSPGDTLQFFATLSNPSSDTVFLNFYGINLSGLPQSSIVNDLTFFFTNVPISLAPGANSGDIELFDIAIPNAFPPSSNDGNYTLIGGGPNDQNIVGTANFTVNVAGVSTVPEPSYKWFLILGIALLTATRKIVKFAFTT
jgi:hypothetical protein